MDAEQINNLIKRYITGTLEVKKCLLCGDRPILMRHIEAMKSGKKCVCEACKAVHVIQDGVVVVIGFRR